MRVPFCDRRLSPRLSLPPASVAAALTLAVFHVASVPAIADAGSNRPGASMQWPGFGAAQIENTFRDDGTTSVLVEAGAGRDTVIVSDASSKDAAAQAVRQADASAGPTAPIEDIPAATTTTAPDAVTDNAASPEASPSAAAAATASNAAGTSAVGDRSTDKAQAPSAGAASANAAVGSEPVSVQSASPAVAEAPKTDAAATPPEGAKPSDSAAAAASQPAADRTAADTSVADKSSSDRDGVPAAAATAATDAKGTGDKAADANAPDAKLADDKAAGANAPDAKAPDATAADAQPAAADPIGSSKAAARSASAKGKPAVSQLSNEISKPKPVYYDKRAEAILKADAPVEVKDELQSTFPEHSMVSCVAGCNDGKAEVVYVSHNSEIMSATTGEVVPSSADAAQPAVEPAITCIAGCYDKPRQRYHSPSRAEIDESLKHSAKSRLSGSSDGGPRKTSHRFEEQPSDWLTVQKVSGSHVARQAAPTDHRDARRNEPSGSWFSRINRSRSRQAN